MIEAILRRLGVPQNAERLKSELAREVNGQLIYGMGAARAGLRAGAMFAIAGVLGIIAVVTLAVLFYSWLALYLGHLGALAVTAGAFGFMSLIFISVAQSRMAEAPVYQTFKLPQLYEKIASQQLEEEVVPPPAQRAANFSNARRSAVGSSETEGETRQWVLGLIKQGYSRHFNTGVGPVDSFIDTIQPEAESMAKEGLQTVEQQLQNGSRPTIAMILIGGLITGFLLSSRGGVKFK